MKFNDYKYTRPDLKEFTQQANQYLEALKHAESFEAFNDAFNALNTLKRNISTQGTLASIRHSINTKDEFYAQEIEFWDENEPHISKLFIDMGNILLESPYKAQLEETVPTPYFKMIENDRRVFDEKIISDLQEENRLSTQYDKLVASAEIEFDGKILNLAQMSPYTQSTDRQVRKEASKATWDFFKENEEKFDDIYDKLVKVRTKMAKTLGFDSFTEMGYLRMNRLDYNQEMVANYRKQILEDVVPVAQKLYKRQAERLGLDKLEYYDVALNFLDGNAKPIGSAEEILEAGKAMYEDLSPETAEFINLMLDNDLMDVLAKPGKRAGGYMTFLPDYEVPFIFSNFNGTSGDIDVLTHEAGHAFQGYQSRHIDLVDVHMPTLEACEIHSMSMEFLTWDYMDQFFGDKADKYKFSHLSDSLQFLPYGVLVDHFQHEVYNNPDMTPQQRKETWRKLDKQYRPHLDFSENPFLDQGVWWFRQGHIFASPFYYIDYTLAQVCAFQFWKRKHIDNDKQAWNDYLHICQLGGTKSFTQIVDEANLISPFEDGCLKSVINDIDHWLENIDDKAL